MREPMLRRSREPLEREPWEPCSFDGDRHFWRLDEPEERAAVEVQIAAARRWLEDVAQWRTIVRSCWLGFLDQFPTCASALQIPGPPLESIVAVTYDDADGAEQTLDPATYWVDTESEPGRLVLVPGASWPATQAGKPNSVRVEYWAGYATADAVPPTTREACRHLVLHWSDHRGVAIAGLSMQELPLGLRTLVSADRFKSL